jgi:GWxTD domain-containing protein
MKSLSKKYCTVLAILFGIIWASCNSISSTTKTETSNTSASFNALAAEVFTYHFSEDSSAVYCSLNAEDLLYARKLGTTDYTAFVSFKYNLFKIEGNTKAFLDSGTFYFKDILSAKRNKSVFKANIPLKRGVYSLQIKVSDIQRKSDFVETLTLDKSNRSSDQNFLIIDQTTGLALAPSQVKKGDSLTIESARNSELAQLHFYSFKSEIKLPPAPFSIANPELPMMTEAEKTSIPFDNGAAQLKVQNHLQLLSIKENPDSGFAFVAFNNEYPEIKKKDDLHAPLRYLTTKQEFENISKARNPKEKVDLFWIECGGSKDRARNLIAAYYERVQIANKFFSSYTEGWRTDRGMIYLVFGEPTRINSTPTQQTWIYGDDSNGTALKFVFSKATSIWSDNVYLLRRDPMFKTHWERMVTSWRNGRVYTNS